MSFNRTAKILMYKNRDKPKSISESILLLAAGWVNLYYTLYI